MTIKRFHLGDVLSVIHGQLVSPNGLAGVLDLLAHLTGQPVTAAEVWVLAARYGPVLLVQFPKLARVETVALSWWQHWVPGVTRAKVAAWLAAHVQAHGETLVVAAIPAPPAMLG